MKRKVHVQATINGAETEFLCEPRQSLLEVLRDELRLDIAPVLLGEGERIFAAGVTPDLELLETEGSPYATHVRYAVRY